MQNPFTEALVQPRGLPYVRDALPMRGTVNRLSSAAPLPGQVEKSLRTKQPTISTSLAEGGK
jgi:hypothetical protein